MSVSKKAVSKKKPSLAKKISAGSEIILPVLPLRDVVVFPQMVVPLFVGREESIHALEASMRGDKHIFLVAQKDPNINSPKKTELYSIGAVAVVLQLLRLPEEGMVKALIEGVHRARLVQLFPQDHYISAQIDEIQEEEYSANAEIRALADAVLDQFEDLVKINKKIPVEILTTLSDIDGPEQLVDHVAAHMTGKLEARQEILAAPSVLGRLELLHDLLVEELDVLAVSKRVKGRVRQQIKTHRRQYYLSEEIKAMQKELEGLEDSSGSDEHKKLLERIKKSGMPKEAEKKALVEANKLKMMPPMSAEATVIRNHLDCLLQVPWTQYSKVNTDVKKAEAILEAGHYGLEEVKQRILEYLAVFVKSRNQAKGPILCFVGPPGVGKSSLGKSVALALGLECARISLGGVRDEAEIRGHRRTYIGALPGKIIQKMIKVGVRNPLFILDEVDKMAMDFRGDPASALLEVLDPEQNASFSDHYLEVDYDLSDVIFIATANSLDIPPALLDRMEVIRLSGYTEDEKSHIARTYLISRQIEQSGLTESEITISDGTIRDMIRFYTREAGVRALEREIAKLCRKVVKAILTEQAESDPSRAAVCYHITRRNIEKYLGVKRYRFEQAEEKDQIGQVAGLAWTEVGGTLLTIEAQVLSGKGKLLQTGRLGDVMQESIAAAMTVVRSRISTLGITKTYFFSHDFHIHVPEGATPKDGPSAGISMCTALVSAIMQIPVRAHVAMTGEITLRGTVLPIGGLKEKLLAALSANITDVIIPEGNERDLKEIPAAVINGLNIHPVKSIDDVFKISLKNPLRRITRGKSSASVSTIKKLKAVRARRAS